MKALVVERHAARFAAARLASALGSGRGAGIGPLRLAEVDPPSLPGPRWHRVDPVLAGICGSDLTTLDGRSSRTLEPYVSFPFVPGHEVLGVLPADATGATGVALAAGTRVVVEPVLACAARGIHPPCPMCARGWTGCCENTAFGHIRPGLQTGYCAQTGGGWSAAGLVAHDTQIHAVPDGLSDADAVTVEPVACAVHAAMGAGLAAGDTVAVLGAGMLGLALTAALSHLGATGAIPEVRRVVVGARYPHQRSMAKELGATALAPSQLDRALRRETRTFALGAPAGGDLRLTGGADVVFDCAGSADSLARCLDMVRPRGRVVLVGMGGKLTVDLASLWRREVVLAGTYAYGTEVPAGQGTPLRTFDLAFEVAAAMGTGRMVSATYPLERFEEALAHAGAAGRRGAVKVAFDLRKNPDDPSRPAGPGSPSQAGSALPPGGAEPSGQKGTPP